MRPVLAGKLYEPGPGLDFVKLRLGRLDVPNVGYTTALSGLLFTYTLLGNL